MTRVNIMASGIRVCQSLVGFGLFPGFTKKHRIDIEKWMCSALGKLINDLAGDYNLITGMGEGVRKQFVDDIFPFVIGDRNLTVAGMKRDWPDSHGIFHNAAGTFLLWVNEKNQMIILPMERGDVRVSLDVLLVVSRLVETLSWLSRYGLVHSCHTMLPEN